MVLSAVTNEAKEMLTGKWDKKWKWKIIAQKKKIIMEKDDGRGW